MATFGETHDESLDLGHVDEASISTHRDAGRTAHTPPRFLGFLDQSLDDLDAHLQPQHSDHQERSA